ncbi:hypothetical protein J6590_037233 [Homalodisca vitripennis]|nr:hypothetical protein J6590_100008 [Homalodisca vitripennis]KAG8321928.1 hypothetical protein J6590_037233 [Homalodisca vitripennis]
MKPLTVDKLFPQEQIKVNTTPSSALVALFTRCTSSTTIHPARCLPVAAPSVVGKSSHVSR